MERIEVAVTFRVLNPDYVRAFAGELGEGQGAGSLADAVAAAAVNPMRAPLDTGFEIVEKRGLETDGEGVFIVRLAADVHDRDTLIAEARNRYKACWFDEDWQPGSLGEALYEVAVASNASPSNDLIGLQTEDVVYGANAELARQEEPTGP